MLLGAVNQRFSAFVQHSEMSDERLERRPVPGRRDHGIGIEPAPVSEDGGALLEPLERSDDTDATGLDAFDKARRRGSESRRGGGSPSTAAPQTVAGRP